MTRPTAPVLTALLALASLAPAAAAEEPGKPEAPPPADAAKPAELPKAAPRAPVPPDPKDTVRKAIQAALLDWFKFEPGLPSKLAPTEIQGSRQGAAGRIEKATADWNATLPAGATNAALRNVAWWKARLDETQPTENRSGKITREEFLFNGQKYALGVSVPKNYRGTAAEIYPVIVTILEKDADPKKVLPAVYGKLLDSHIVVASFENNLKDAQGRESIAPVLFSVYYPHLLLRADRDRVTLDGIGKAARFVDELAGDHALQWNGVVFRDPATAPELAENLAMFPCCVAVPGTVPEGMATAIAAIEKGCPETTKVPAPAAADETALATIRDWIAALPSRRVADQKISYRYSVRSTGRFPKWGYWFVYRQPVEGGPGINVSVKVSRDPELNLVDLECTNLAQGTLLLNDEVLDLDQPVTVRVNGIVVAREKPVRSLMTTFHSGEGLAATKLGPRNYFIVATIPFFVEGDALIPEAERKALAEAKRRAAEIQKQEEEAARKRAEEEAKGGGAAPVPAPGENPPAPGDGAGKPETPPAPEEPVWLTGLAEAIEAAKKDGRQVVVVFTGAPDAKNQATLEKALGDGETKAALVRYACVRLSAEGEAGAPTKARLDQVESGAVAPFVAVLKAADETTLRKLAVAPLEEAEVLPEVLRLLKEPVEAPKTLWIRDYDQAIRAARENGNVLVVHFASDVKAKGQEALNDCLEEPEAREQLARLTCAMLPVEGDAKNLQRLKDLLSKDKEAPVLAGFELQAGENPPRYISILEPHNISKGEVRRKLRILIDEWLAKLPKPVTAAPADGGAKPAEAKPEEKK